MCNTSSQDNKAFTLIELLVVIAIIGILSSVVLAALSGARESARDTRRLQDMQQIQTALEMYHNDHGRYPDETNDVDSCDSGSSTSYECSTEDGGDFLGPLVDDGYLPNHIVDPLNEAEYHYVYFYANGSSPYGCKNSFYVFIINTLESYENRHPDSPGFKCGSVNWDGWGDYSTGSFE